MDEKKQKLEMQVDLCGAKLDRAKRLIKGLGGEKERWEGSVKDLEVKFSHLLGDVLVSSACIAYLGPFTLNYREKTINHWLTQCKIKTIPCSASFSLISVLGDPVLIQSWNICGLPNDQLSVDNAVYIQNSKKWALMIDPQNQAGNWIKQTNKPNLRIIKLSDSDYMRTLENCVTFGNPLLLENLQETLDSALEPLLLKQIYKQNGIDMIRLGENVIEFSNDFRFFMTTKLRNPHYFPEVASKVLLLNFMIVQEGLDDQLLGIVVAKERPDLESERQSLILQSAENNKQLKEIEDKILFTLSNSKGNILENETAVDFLGKSKILSTEVSKKQKVAMETEKEIENSRQCYKCVAKHSAILYFCVADLPNIDPMYQFSLTWFINLFKTSISDSQKSKILEKRLKILKSHFQYILYENISRSLAIKHKIVFSLLLCFNQMISNKELSNKELVTLFTGGVSLNPLPLPSSLSWISLSSWVQLNSLISLSCFSNFLKSFVEKSSEWKSYYDNENPYHFPLPSPWNQSLNKFQKLMILRCLRPEKVMHALEEFVGEYLGKEFIEPPPFDLSRCYDDSSYSLPLIFILSSGSDPSTQLIKFANDKGFQGDKFQSISLGQGQGPIAAKAIEKAKKIGGWVLLQNCHLAVSWMPKLEKICEEISCSKSFSGNGTSSGEVHEKFRLWITSYPSVHFPISILQNGIKMVDEPPLDLKQNLLLSYNSLPTKNNQFYYSFQSPKQLTYERLIFGLCFFHALIQERKQFGPQGFNIKYSFSDADLKISLEQLQIFIRDYKDVPFDALTYLTGECNYGGKVTDERDRKCLMTILNTYYHPSILLPNYSIYNKELPSNSSRDAYIEFIKDLPIIQEPSIFGLHQNIKITTQTEKAKSLFNDLLSVSGSTFSRAASQSEKQLLSIINDILVKLNHRFDINKASLKFPVEYGDTLNTVLVQEMGRFNKLTGLIIKSLFGLQEALKGKNLMKEVDEEIMKEISLGKVPSIWMKSSYPSVKPLSGYVKDLVARVNFFQNWYDKGKPKIFWLGGFYFIQAFLTGVTQNFARANQFPIDSLTFDFQVFGKENCSFPDEVFSEGVLVEGLFLDGAKWDSKKNCLEEQDPGNLRNKLPITWFRPTNKKNLPSQEEEKRYNCPLYKTSQRFGTLTTTGHSTNFVMGVLLESLQPVEHWIKRGTALLCQLDD